MHMVFENNLSTEVQMNGINHIRTIQCHFQSRKIHNIAIKHLNVKYLHTLHYLLLKEANKKHICSSCYNADRSPCAIHKGSHGKY